MRKILDFQNKLTPANDKLGHFFWGFWYALFGVLLYFLTGWIYWIVIPSVFFASSKEILDYFGFGNCEVMDFVFTIIPSIVFGLLIYLI
jgi:hypothetical protein